GGPPHHQPLHLRAVHGAPVSQHCQHSGGPLDSRLTNLVTATSKEPPAKMAIKQSELYSSLWASCDALRGGMDASQYKDYVLFMLFIKYISDKYANYDGFEPPVVIPKGASFKDMVQLKGKADIGDKINTQVIQPLIEA